MPIVPPQLDDLTYDRVVAELTRRIPVYSPEWTDFNDSDPGITLIQLFAYLSEMVGYRLNRVPEKNQIELLRLLGVELNPAHAAATKLALLLSDPATLQAYTLTAGASAKATTGSPPPAFETDGDIDVVPAQPVVLATTVNAKLYDPGNPGALAGSKPKDFLTLVWDGKSPQLKDLPQAPVTLAPANNQRYLWVGVSGNSAPGAGFLGVKVVLTVQLDDDEQPTFTVAEPCGPQSPSSEQGVKIGWLSYYDAKANDMLPVPGRIDDTTNHLANSGTLTFTVPATMGPIPAGSFLPLFNPSGQLTPAQACVTLANNLGGQIGNLTLANSTASDVTAWVASYTTALKHAVSQTTAPPQLIPNPLDPKYYGTPAWFRIDLSAAPAAPTRAAKLRMITFNAVPATNATTVVNELLGVADGTPGQTYRLANANVQPGTLQVAMQESPANDNAPLVSWQAVNSLDAAGPFDRVCALDPEAGTLVFGDGINGRVAPLVPQGGYIVALSYRWGGGEAGNVKVGTITTMNGPGTGIGGVVNYVAASGGRDAETLTQAEIRARKELSTRSRAVTATDFEWIASRTPGVEVARAHAVPLRRPLDESSQIVPVFNTPCGANVPTVAAGLGDAVAAGAVSVVVVPDQSGPEPTPTPSFLLTVCRYLDAFRLVTTEVYVVPPQYARLCNVRVNVAAQPGYTRAALQTLVSARLAAYLHVLTGGDNGAGFEFGGQLHVADLIAQVYRVEGVARVDTLTADFVRTKSDASPRQGSLALCPGSSGSQYDHLSLAPEESMSFNVDTFLLSTVS